MLSSIHNTIAKQAIPFPQHNDTPSQQQGQLTATWITENNRLVCKWVTLASPTAYRKAA